MGPTCLPASLRRAFPVRSGLLSGPPTPPPTCRMLSSLPEPTGASPWPGSHSLPGAALRGGAWQPTGTALPSSQVSQPFPGLQDLVFHHLLAQLGRNLYGSLLHKEAAEMGGGGALRLSRRTEDPEHAHLPLGQGKEGLP